MQGGTTNPLYIDVELPAGAQFAQPIGDERNAFVYIFEGSATVADRALDNHHAAILGPGDQVAITAGSGGARFLLLAALPLNEPVVQYGPFVMNTREEIDQAIRDYQSGQLTAA
jgi:redox-sensitive bicupin YhaK (pirin superfamily)